MVIGMVYAIYKGMKANNQTEENNMSYDEKLKSTYLEISQNLANKWQSVVYLVKHKYTYYVMTAQELATSRKKCLTVINTFNPNN